MFRGLFVLLVELSTEPNVTVDLQQHFKHFYQNIQYLYP